MNVVTYPPKIKRFTSGGRRFRLITYPKDRLIRWDKMKHEMELAFRKYHAWFGVYVLCSENGGPFYVGKGQPTRPAALVREALHGFWDADKIGLWHYQNKRPVHLHIRKLMRDGDIWIILDTVHGTETFARLREADLIDELGRRCDGSGPLLNMRRGGGGR